MSGLRIIGRTAVALGFLLASTTPSFAFDLRTHLWIAEILIQDLGDDGRFSLGDGLGDQDGYAPPPDVVQAILQNANEFRAGILGPDIYPDLVVGQMTTHPGVEGGWQADDFMRRLYEKASPGAELAFAAGYIGHAASDIFAHTYVNMYAGDIFLLTDGERDVELRHFVLERYIGNHLPSPGASTTFAVPTSFLRDQLILDEEISEQNLKSGAGQLLTAMQLDEELIRNTLREWRNLTDKVFDLLDLTIKNVNAFTLQKQSTKIALDATELAFKTEEQLFHEAQKILEHRKEDLRKAVYLIDNLVPLQNAQRQIISAQKKIFDESAGRLSDVLGEVSKIESKIRSFGGDVCKAFGPFSWVSPNCATVEGLNRLLGEKRTVAGQLQSAVDHARNLIDQAVNEIQNLADRAADFQKKIKDGVFDAAIQAASATLEVHAKLLAVRNQAFQEARAAYEEISNSLQKEIEKRLSISDFLKRMEPVAILLDNWHDGIRLAVSAYVDTSTEVARDMIRSEGKELERYLEWVGCYQSYFMQPIYQIPDATCKAKAAIDELNDKLTDILHQVPEILQWVIAPTVKIRETLEPKLREVANNLFLEGVKLLTDSTTKELVELMMKPENATASRLNDVYGRNKSRKALLTFGSVSGLIDQDMHLGNGVLDPDEFLALRNAVILTKLSLLSHSEMNRLATDLGYKGELYPNGSARFSILFDALRSLDGNHQWQPYALPYPRSEYEGELTSICTPLKRHFGYDPYREGRGGFRLWADEQARQKVFLKLFRGDVMGALATDPGYLAVTRHFLACERNPFPSTMDSRKLLFRSDACSDHTEIRMDGRSGLSLFDDHCLDAFNVEP